MKKDQIRIGGIYTAKVSGQVAQVRILAESPYGGWDAQNVATARKVRIKSAQRLRREVPPEKAGGPTAYRAKREASGDWPPQDIDDQPPQDDEVEYDPDQCGTSRCRGKPVMTYLGRPLCQRCWDKHCEGQDAAEAAARIETNDVVTDAPDGADASVHATHESDASAPKTNEQENTMSTKKTKKRGATKAEPTTAKAKANTTKAASKPTTKAGADAAPKHGKDRKPAADKPKRVSALDAAATVLKKAGKPMRAQELINAMAAQALWKSPGGRTPHATLYAAILREITAKGKEARFKKVERGQFEFVG